MSGEKPAAKGEISGRIGRAVIGLAAPVLLSAGLAALVPSGAYLWFKAFHLIAAMIWVGGMVGLIGLFAWHAQLEPGSPASETLAELERRILQHVVNPAMILAWGVGLWLGWEAGWFSSPWLQAKLVLVLALSGLHGWVVGAVRAFAQGGQIHRAGVYRLVSIAGALGMIATVMLAVVKPM